MNEHNNPTQDKKQTAGSNTPAATDMIETFMTVLRRPADFFIAMPRTGGFAQPLIFMIVMGIVSGLIRALLGLTGLLPGMHIAMALASVIIAPIIIAIFGFIVAGILFVIWKLMGSDQNFETAYRCTAYGSAISPVTQVLMVIPYVGVVLVLAWWTFILVLASTKVHRIRQGTATTVFAIFAVLLAVLSVSGQFAARRMENALRNTQFDKSDAKDPAKAMQQLGKMFEQMGKAAQEQQKPNQ